MATEPPAAPSRGRELRAGWRTLLASTTGIGVGVAVLPLYTLGLVIPELEQAFGWSRPQLSSLQLIGSVCLILTAPLIGTVIDRLGARIPAVFSLAALGLGFMALSLAGPSFTLYLVVFTAMYLLASGSTPVSFTRALNARFVRARGMALGLALAGAGLVAFLVPVVMGPRFADDWRLAYRTLGLVVLVVAVLVWLLWARERHPATVDPGAEAVPGPTAPAWHDTVPWMRTGLFARLMLAYLLLALAVGGLTVHLVPLLRDAGVTPARAAATAGAIGIAIIVGRLVVGALIDRHFAPRVTALVLLVAALGYATLVLGGPSLAVVAALGAGLALGAEVDVIGYLTARYYPLEHYGRLFGVFYAAFTLGIGGSPLIMAWLRAATGSYIAPLTLCIGLLLGAALLFLTAPRFDAPTRVEPADAHLRRAAA
jgi:MFS family permease